VPGGYAGMHSSLISSVLTLDAITFHIILDSRMFVDPYLRTSPLSGGSINLIH
jgi:hypothetical protein